MAVAANPTVEDLCEAALKQAGIPSPTTTQISELAEDGFQNVKTQLWLACPTDHLLESHAYVQLTAGNGHLTTPTDLESELYVDVHCGPEDYAGTAQSGTTNTITLDADLSVEETALQGLFLFITGGPGSGQYRQIIDWDNTTKIATFNQSLLTSPSSSTTYLITTQERRLTRKDEVSTVLSWALPNIGYPKYYTKIGVSPTSGSTPLLRIFPAPDHARYACVLTYKPNLTLMDEASTLFVKHMRERRTLWMQGLKVEAMQRYDDDRYMQALSLWQGMLRQYGTHNYNQMQAEGNR